tara:strand:+ start:767 stop:940 length:174 start_codon:yes stop_codon:yes gene_type:complete
VQLVYPNLDPAPFLRPFLRLAPFLRPLKQKHQEPSPWCKEKESPVTLGKGLVISILF